MSVQEVRKAKRYLEGEYRKLSWWKDYQGKDWTKARQAGDVEYWIEKLGIGVSVLMAAAKAKKTNVPAKPEWKGFVNYVLSVEDKERYKTWDVDDHDLFALVAGDVSAGYKVGVSYNPQNDTFVATYMCNTDGDPNQGYMLSAFAPDWYNAVKSLCFKHNVVLEGVWPVGKAAEKDSWG